MGNLSKTVDFNLFYYLINQIGVKIGRETFSLFDENGMLYRLHFLIIYTHRYQKQWINPLEMGSIS